MSKEKMVPARLWYTKDLSIGDVLLHIPKEWDAVVSPVDGHYEAPYCFSEYIDSVIRDSIAKLLLKSVNDNVVKFLNNLKSMDTYQCHERFEEIINNKITNIFYVIIDGKTFLWEPSVDLFLKKGYGKYDLRKYLPLPQKSIKRVIESLPIQYRTKLYLDGISDEQSCVVVVKNKKGQFFAGHKIDNGAFRGVWRFYRYFPEKEQIASSPLIYAIKQNKNTFCNMLFISDKA